MSWKFYFLLALSLLFVMAFKLTKVLALIVILSVVLVFIIAYFSKKEKKQG